MRVGHPGGMIQIRRGGGHPIMSFSPWLRALLVAACAMLAPGLEALSSPRPPARGAEPARRERSASENAMFAFLTAGLWCPASNEETSAVHDGVYWTGSFQVIAIRANGEFRRTFHSDYSDVLVEGDWDFSLESSTRGRLRVNGRHDYNFEQRSHEYIFERRGEDLWLAGERLVRCRGEHVMTGQGSASELRRVKSPALLDTLCANDWIKEDDFDLSRL